MSGESSDRRRGGRGGVLRRCCSRHTLLAVHSGALLGLLPLVAGPVAIPVEPLPYVPGSPHQAYGYELAQGSLARDPRKRDWLAAADAALLGPAVISLPFATQGQFKAGAAAALGFRFTVRDGQRVRVDTRFQAPAAEVFVDLYRVAGGRLERIGGSLPGAPAQPLDIEALEPAEYVLRVQPRLEAAANYELAIGASPLLTFPVLGHDPGAIQSGFGAERDGGRRAHRGVDIFAPRGTTAVAATDGWVMRVETTRVGGNVVWMQPLFGNMRLYYAHLDRQLVERGQFVRAGDPIGTVGNTGNARTTPPHLHFGVYVRRDGMRGGARDPDGFLR
jgi:murein DD-endopeptidase MepM/ murein hydrolase activator NlpD